MTEYNSPIPSAHDRYHHGNLRAALFEAILDYVRREGIHTLSLRHISKQIGVSPGAAYRHFENRQAIIDALVFYGLTCLAERTEKSTRDLSKGPRLVAAGMAYIEFARSEPNLFSVTFGSEGEKARLKAVTMTSEDLGFTSASDQLRTALEGVLGHPADYTDMMAAWGLAHGLAALSASGVFRGSVQDTITILENFTASLIATDC